MVIIVSWRYVQRSVETERKQKSLSFLAGGRQVTPFVLLLCPAVFVPMVMLGSCGHHFVLSVVVAVECRSVERGRGGTDAVGRVGTVKVVGRREGLEVVHRRPASKGGLGLSDPLLCQHIILSVTHAYRCCC